ncbi:MAG: hypothetical protein LBV08_02380 [Clostridiales bacterium]|nr:hypothetical protein [Clostridiales bacterium]
MSEVDYELDLENLPLETDETDRFDIDKARGIITVNGSEAINIRGAGTAIITASQAGDGTYAPAPNARKTLLVVDKLAPPTLQLVSAHRRPTLRRKSE